MQSQSKRRLRYLEDAVAALSLANLIFIHSWFGNLYDVSFGYYSKQPLTATILLAMLCNLLGFASLFWLGAQVFRRHRHWGLNLAGGLFLLAALLPAVELFRVSYLGITDGVMATLVRGPTGLGVVAVLLVATLLRPRWVVRAVAALLLLLSPMALFVLARTVVVLCQLQFAAPPAGGGGTAPLALHSNLPPTRVVWIIFDELDQRLAVAQPPAGVKLPELDRLRNQSLWATNAYPPALSTRASLPSLLTGKVFQDAQPTSANDLRLSLSADGQPAQFSQMTNVFDEVRAGGGNTAVVGFYHPYARLLQRSLNSGAWIPFALGVTRNRGTFVGALLDQWGNVAHALYWRFWHREYVGESIQHSLSAVTNGAYALTLLHLPYPHSPTVYDPAHQRLVVFTRLFPKGYLDNLQLTDHVLGQLRRAMEQAGQWDSTWLLVSADHGWRSSRAYDGQLDHRIPYILKPPGQASPICYGPILNAAVTKDLILAILRGQVRNLPDAEAWLNARPGTVPEYDLSVKSE